MRERWWGVLCAGALAACGGGGDGEAGPGSDAGAGGGSGEQNGGAGGAPGPAICTLPEGATVVLDWARRSEEGTDGSPVYNLTVDADFLYVQLIDRIVRVPVGGGEETLVFTNRAEIPVFTNAWVRADDRLLVADGVGVALVPKAGGEAAPVNLPENAWLGTLSALGAPYDPVADTLYISSFTSMDGRTLTGYHAYDIAAGTRTPVVEGVEVANPGAYDYAGGSFFYQPAQDDPTLQATSDGGANWETLTFTSPPGTTGRFAGIHGGHLWFVVSNFMEGFSGLARAPSGGGEMALAIDDFTISTQLAKGEGHVALNDADSLLLSPLDGTGRIIPLATGNDCTSHAVAVGAGKLFSSFFRASTGETLVFSLPL